MNMVKTKGEKKKSSENDIINNSVDEDEEGERRDKKRTTEAEKRLKQSGQWVNIELWYPFQHFLRVSDYFISFQTFFLSR